MNGVQITTPQLGFSAFNVSFNSFAKAIPSCRFMFIFQLPATIFFLIFLLFIKSLYILFFLSLFLTHFDQAHILSAKVSTTRGKMNQSIIFIILPGMESEGTCPTSTFSSLPLRSYSSGRLLWLHLRILVPFLSNSIPGLLRMIVFSVVSSVLQNGYSAPDISHQRVRALPVLAVKQ